MLPQSKLREQIEGFSKEFSIDELVERLILVEKIDRGNKQSEKEEVISKSELDVEIEKWFK